MIGSRLDRSSAPPPRRRRARRVVGVVLGVLLLALAGFAVWFRLAGGDFLWSKIQPRHARLLALQGNPEIPEDLPAAAWDDDVRTLASELTRRYARFQTAGPVYDRAAFDAEAERLRARLPGLSRQQVELGLMGIAALPGGGHGHTGIVPFQRPLDWRMYPLSTWVFDDGVWVVLAAGGAEPALGHEIVAVGGFPVDEVLARAAPFLPADNAWSRRTLEGAVFSFAEMLQGLGVVGADGIARLTLRDRSGALSELALEPAPLPSLAGLRWGRTLQSPIAGDPLSVASPADPRPRARPFDLLYRPENRLLFLRIDRMEEEGEETFERLVERLRVLAAARPIERFVIDLRANGGGNNQLARPLVEYLAGNPAIDRRGVLYTLIGRRTNSAAGNLAMQLERRTRTLFAGEPSGFRPNHWGDPMELPLPRSKIFVRISTRHWQEGGPWDRRDALAPSPGLAVGVRHADHAAGRDPVLEAVLAHRPEPIAEIPLAAAEARALAERVAGVYRFGEYRKLVVAAAPETARLRMTIEGVDRWAESDLYPVAAEGAVVRWATALEGVFLELGADAAGEAGELTIAWHGERRPLPRVEDGYRTPIEILRGTAGAGSSGLPTDAEVRAGVAAFRERAASPTASEIPDSWTEFALEHLGYALLEAERTEEAVEVFRLQTELFPEIGNSFASLGDGYEAAGERDLAVEAHRRALALDADFGYSRRKLAELGASPSTAGTDRVP